MIRKILWVFVTTICVVMPLQASDSVIKGLVTDTSGKPIRGALVKATAVGKTITRFTQGNGRYELTVTLSDYLVSAEAYGFGTTNQQRSASQTGELNFTLSPRKDVMHLTGADITNLLPNDQTANMVKSICINCHSFGTILNRRGSTAAEWEAFLPTMASRMGSGVRFNNVKMDAITKELERLFGPTAQYFGPDATPPAPEQVKHPRLSDEVLKATITEYQLPSQQTMPHSLTVDPKGDVWVAGYDIPTNAIERFDPKTEQFHVYPLQTPHAVPHTPCVGNDGQVWMALSAFGNEAKLATVDIQTQAVREVKWVGTKRAGAHSCTLDKAGNIWMATLGEKDEFYVYDAEKHEFRGIKYPIPTKYPEGSKGAIEAVPGEPAAELRAGSYDVRVDSAGKVWLGLYTLGWIVSYDPAKAEIKEYKPPHTPSIRGILVDSHDNIWFSAFDSHKLGKLDQKTGKITLYQPPTVNAAPYGLLEDKRTGYIWFPDLNGNNIDRFDPKTEKFVEYPIPTANSYPRLGIGLDAQGRIWYTEWLNPKIAVLDPGDKIN